MTVEPLRLGTLTVDKSTLTFMRDFGVSVDVPVVAWLIRSSDRVWLVDTGAPPPAFTQKHFCPMTQAPEETLGARLDAAGIDPEAVDTVVLTHLHFDHVGGNHLFPHAQFVVQRSELEYARAPLPVHCRGYQHPSAGFRDAAWSDVDWLVVDGDVELAPGLRVILTPGHTPGLQALVVDGASGRLVIASDTVPLYENWLGRPPVEPHIPSGVHVDLSAYYESFGRLEAEGGTLLPGHDPALFRLPSSSPSGGR